MGLGNEAFLGKIPGMWLGKSYGSRKSLAGYFADLIQRLLFFKKWLKTNPPVVFWLSGFFFTHAFTCGAAQNYARKYTIPVDAVVFDQHMLPKDDYKKKPKDGVYTYGLFLEGGRWNKEKFTLGERMPKILFTPAPLMWIVPLTKAEIEPKWVYSCPVYKTSDRRGILATTGHSTNFVTFMRMPIAEDSTPEHWVERGCAMLTQLDD